MTRPLSSTAEVGTAREIREQLLEVAALLREAGAKELEVGISSLDDDIVRIRHKIIVRGSQLC